jgi:hypothetical protein
VPRDSTGAHLSKEVRTGAVGHVAAPEPTSTWRCGPKLQFVQQRVDARPVSYLNLEPIYGVTSLISKMMKSSGQGRRVDSTQARSAYLMQFQSSLKSDFKKLIWQVWVPSCCKFFVWMLQNRVCNFFVWLMLQNRVWTADRLLLRQWPNEYFCPLCEFAIRR